MMFKYIQTTSISESVKSLRDLILTGILAFSSVAVGPPAIANADSLGETELVGVSSDIRAISSDGRYVYFSSSLSTLVQGDTNGVVDIFVRDRQIGTTTRLNVATDGQQSNNAITGPFDVSDDGRYIVFASAATNLVAPDFNQGADIYLRDVQAGTTSLVYRNSITGQSASRPVISGDGNHITYTAADPANGIGYNNIYLFNRLNGVTSRISNAPSGIAGNNSSVTSSINHDGSMVAFDSLATNLVSNDTNNQNDVFLWQSTSNGVSRISISSSLAQGNNHSQLPSISDNGQKIVFESYATSLTAIPTDPNRSKTYLHNTVDHSTVLLSVTPDGTEVNGNAQQPLISGDGTMVIFSSTASDITPADANSTGDIFARDLLTDTTSLISLDPNGAQFATFGAGGTRAVSSTGRFVTFNAFVQGTGNGAYLRDRLPDNVPPTVTGTPDRQPNAEGWYDDDVMIMWTSIDPAPSSGTPTQPTAILASLEGEHTYTSTPSCDPSGNCATGSVTIKVDKSKPTISSSIAPDANANGWHNDNVQVAFICTDAESGVDTCPDSTVLSQDGANQTATGTAKDNAGNSTSHTTSNISIDKTTPTISYTASSAANSNGWNDGAVTISFNCADALSGVASCTTPVTLTTDGIGQTVIGTAIDNAGNSSMITVIVNIDSGKPTIVYAANPSPNSYGWNNSDVALDFMCTDGLSGIASCTGSTILTSEGTNQTRTGTATDNAGHTTSLTTIGVNIDKTLPTTNNATLSNLVLGILIGNPPVTITANANDALSGVLGGEFYIDNDPGVGRGTPMLYNVIDGKLTFNGRLGLGAELLQTHQLYIRSIDKAGNYNTTSMQFVHSGL